MEQTNDNGGAEQDLAGTKPAGKAEATVKARVLVDCDHGKPNDVVALPKSVALAAEKAGIVDSTREAVAYAESIAPQE